MHSVKRSILEIILLITSICVVAPKNLHAEQLMGVEISQSEYIGGGLVGTVIGFGTGHLIQGQTERGLTFMSAQLAAVAIGAIGWAKLTEESAQAELLFIGAALFGALRVYEGYDLWERPVRRGNNFYIPVREIKISPDVTRIQNGQWGFGLVANVSF